ncbi:MAG TPA: hypothetical protein PKW30_02755 [Campylobacterales bacterium]|nr:hypothetical protein [Campylobacterales bacterium]
MSQNSNHYGVSEPHALVRDFMVGFVSGAVVSAVKNSAREVSQNEKIKDGLKTAIQSGVAAATISRSNRQMTYGHHLDAMLSLAIGAGTVYMIEKTNESKKQYIQEVKK